MEDDYRDILNATCGIIFLGTPHQGSDVSSLGAFAASVTSLLFGSNKMLLISLQKHSAGLSDLQNNFSASISKDIILYSFYETMPTYIFNCIPVGLVSLETISRSYY